MVFKKELGVGRSLENPTGLDEREISPSFRRTSFPPCHVTESSQTSHKVP